MSLVGSVLGDDDLARLADDLVAGVAEQSFCGRVPAPDDAVQGTAADGFPAELDDCHLLAHQLAVPLGPVARGHVSNRSYHQQAVSALSGGQADVGREYGAIVAHPNQLQVGAHWPGPGSCVVLLPVPMVDQSQRLRHQMLDGHSNQVVAFITEQRLPLTIGQPDHTRLVHSQQGIRHRFQQVFELRGLGRHLIPPRD